MSTPCYVYLMCFESGKVKIGLSHNPLYRFNRLKEHENFNEVLVDIFYRKLKDKPSAKTFEKYLHNKYKEYNLTLTDKFEGYTEFFDEVILEMGAVPLVLNKKLEGFKGAYINPLKSVEELPTDFKEELRLYFKDERISRALPFWTNRFEQTVKTFVANIITQPEMGFSFPQTLSMFKDISGIHNLHRRLTKDNYIHIQKIISKYTFSITTNRFGKREKLYEYVSTFYTKGRCGLPFLRFIVEDSIGTGIESELLKAFYTATSTDY